MTGTLLTGQGELPLPEFTRYCLLHTDGSSADSFSLSFPTVRSLLPGLRQCADIRITEGSQTRFRGVVDEVETEYGDHFLTTLTGRGLAARLMDTQADGAEFYSLDLNTVLERYVRPCGISAVRTVGGPWRAQLLSVAAGASCHQVLIGFCFHAGAPQPRFLADGTLYFGPGGEGPDIEPELVLYAARRLCRYGVIRAQKVYDLTNRSVRTAENPALAALDIRARRVATRSGLFTHITERTAQMRLVDSAQKLDLLELALPGIYAGQPGDRVRVTLPSQGADERFTIIESCRQYDGNCEETRLTLRAGRNG